jgi:MFS family permease
MVQALSWLIMPAMVGPVVGPPLGGFIVTYLNWRWIFYLNIPIGLIGLVLATRFIKEFKGDKPAPTDFGGFVLSGVALSCLLFGFETLSRSGEETLSVGLVAVGLAAGALYVRHARRRDHPILDLSLLRTSTFRLSFIAGSVTRIGQGAQPFLLPLMLQVGFGMSAAASGTITLANAAGAVVMKGLAPKLLRRFGFRNSLVFNGLVSSAAYASCALFRPSWPTWAIFAVLMAGGFFMSFQFTGYNTIAYDEIPPERMSAATSFYATFQQLLLSMGVCAGAGALHLSMLVSGHAQPAMAEFTTAFLLVNAVSALSVFWNLRFSADAGDGMTGRNSVGLAPS